MARINRLVTSGTFSLDGGTWDVDNNVWIVGDDETCVVIDPAHDAEAVQRAVNGRQVVAILLTHGHDDHIRAVGMFRALVDAPVLLHPDDRMLWDAVYPDQGPDGTIEDGDAFTVAGTTLTALHTPGHSPGSVCFHAPGLTGEDGAPGVVFTGDTLFQGGPGATGRSYSDFGTIIESIRARLLTLPAETTVHTGHGDSTTIGAEAPHLQEWIDRGH
ncbi:MBL fold metallo-hydrolase [Citricoccus sp. SGAir0253]|uniref:MBL fold metallo-hydrolase n=1 Tax=Citricoccus sp. SGAir0253 TaxID=2567881 RepID=UPI0010CD5B79|nr:MBL fold metallo-hydrolase [Citricoccus sp. SGAir0253]QCU78189.1 MBL fold metallo-hydrolase [Citricoccus sp. SGAir0253]